MTDAPERIWVRVDEWGDMHVNPHSWDNAPKHLIEYVRVIPAEEDAGDDARIAAASRREWAERAWRAEAELEIFRTSGIIEVAVRNPSVMDYMKHWEGRAEKAEAERDRLRQSLERIVARSDSILTDVRSAHSARRDYASEWMREDDRDFLNDLRRAFEFARAALNGET